MRLTSERYWTGSVGVYDDFDRPYNGVMFDAKTKYGFWASMSLFSFLAHSHGRLGPGWGQMYEKQADGRWLKVGGR